MEHEHGVIFEWAGGCLMFDQKNGTGNRDSARKPADSKARPKYNFRQFLIFPKPHELPVRCEYPWETLNAD